MKSVFEESQGIKINNEVRLFDRKEIPHYLEVHSARSDYAISMYNLYQKELCASGHLYHCRKDKIGITYDKGVLQKVSEELGHHRCDVVVNHYLYK